MSISTRGPLAPARLLMTGGRRLPVPTTNQFLAFAIGLAVLHGTGLVGDAAMVLLSVVTPLVLVVGVRVHRPRSPRPWILLTFAGVVWSAAGAIRAAVSATGDLTASRNLLPDGFAILGYTLFAVALLQMVRAQGTRARSRAIVLDGAILAVTSMLICWVALIAPVLYRVEAAWIAKLAIVVYPPISAFLVFVAARLAFAGSSGGTSHRLLLLGMLAVLIGDIAYVPLETHVFAGVPGRVLELPYALAYALIGAAALHPSIRDTVRSSPSPGRSFHGRFALIAVALVTPALMLLVWAPSSMVERLVVGGLAISLEVAAVLRVVLAARSQELVEERLAYRASHDELTDLLNRAAVHELLDQRLEDARAEHHPVSIFFVDLDRFKLVNDSYGHAVGDELLVAAAHRLQSVAGDGQTVARLSGDEFLVVAPGVGGVKAKRLASVLCAAFTEPFQLIGTAYVTASVGIVTTERVDATTNATGLLRDADTAMYEAKAAGRSAYAMFDPAMRAKSEHRLDLYNGLHLAIERDEFEVHYQPIVDPRCGVVRGVEALVRWRSSQGLVPPDEFIALAEETGLIASIGEIVLREACGQVERWRRLPGCEDLTVSVNVSARQVVDVDMVAVVADALVESNLPADALWLEITESVMMTDTLETLASLSGLRGLGVHLSVDDFGTGYSSLSYLQRYPVEQVKIDRQLIGGLCEGSEPQAIVAAVFGIAEALRLSLIAEGVETEAQATSLIDLGCELVQGYLYARPMPAIDVGPILLERNESERPPQSGRQHFGA